MGYGDPFRRPFSGKDLDDPGGDTGDLGSPLRSLGLAVFFAEDILFEFVEANHVTGDVLFVVSPLGYPYVSDSDVQGRVGVWSDGDPFVGVDRGAVIEVGADIDGFYAQLREPIAHSACHLAGKPPGRRLRVGAPEEEPVGISCDIEHHVCGGHLLSEAFHPPHMLGSPPPAFPTVRIPAL